MRKDPVRQWIVVLAVIATIVINGLANALPLNGLTTGEISDRFQVYFVPAGYVFSIWGLIYIALIAYAIYQALPAQREDPHLRSTGYPFVLACAANITWLFLWHYELFTYTILAMLMLLILLVYMYLRLGIGGKKVPAARKWFVHIPFSIYLGWITVATIANVTSLLDYLNWGAWGIAPEAWAVVMLVVAGGITATVLFTRRDVAYGLVIVWAFVGIAIKHRAVPTVTIAAWIVAALVAWMILLRFWGMRSRTPAAEG